MYELNFNTSKKLIKKMSHVKARKPFDKKTCEFLSELSINIKKNLKSKNYPDLITFAFYCRKGNLEIIKQNYSKMNNRLGRGNIFHITPSNIAINFAYSFVFGLLSGNNNIIRLPSKDYEQIKIFLHALNKTFKKRAFKEFKKFNYFVKYKKNPKITEILSNFCDMRIVWGGDKTIEDLRSIKLPSGSNEIVFPDRYSITLVDAKKFNHLNNLEISKVANNFFNDTYIVDQNACSSPHMVIWVGNIIKKKNEKFWEELSRIVKKKYKLTHSHSLEKYNKLLKSLGNNNNIISYKNYFNYVYCVKLSNLDKNVTNLRGKYGLFFEYFSKNLNVLGNISSKKIQTVTYHGFEKKKLVEFVIDNKLRGIDRIVPIGRALDIGLIWDGYDLAVHLSREIDVK